MAPCGPPGSATGWGVSDLSRIYGWADITKRDASGGWGITGKGTQKDGAYIESLPESGKSTWKWMKDDLELVHSKHEATDENDLDCAIPVFWL